MFLLFYFYAAGRFAFVRSICALAPRTALLLLLSGVMVATNWLIYIYAVQNDQVLQTSLGYFILPLLSIFMGYIVFKERVYPLQWLSIGLATFGIVYVVAGYGEFPWIALALAFSFGIYSVIQKKVKINSRLSLLVETLCLTPFALLYLLLLYRDGGLFFLSAGVLYDAGMVGMGLVTLVPLVLFSQSVKHIPFLVVGFTQFYLPSVLFLIGVLWFDEVFTLAYQVTFGFIWFAIIIFIYDSIRRQRKGAPRS